MKKDGQSTLQETTINIYRKSETGQEFSVPGKLREHRCRTAVYAIDEKGDCEYPNRKLPFEWRKIHVLNNEDMPAMMLSEKEFMNRRCCFDVRRRSDGNPVHADRTQSWRFIHEVAGRVRIKRGAFERVARRIFPAHAGAAAPDQKDVGIPCIRNEGFQIGNSHDAAPVFGDIHEQRALEDEI